MSETQQLYCVELTFVGKEAGAPFIRNLDKAGLVLVDSNLHTIKECIDYAAHKLQEQLYREGSWEEIFYMVKHIEAVEGDFYFDSRIDKLSISREPDDALVAL